MAPPRQPIRSEILSTLGGGHRPLGRFNKGGPWAATKALLEASRNDAIEIVPVKSEDQQAMAALHRIRSGFLQTRTARINAVRGHLREFGVSIPAGAGKVVPFAHSAIEQDAVPEALGSVLLELLDDIEHLAAQASRRRQAG